MGPYLTSGLPSERWSKQPYREWAGLQQLLRSFRSPQRKQGLSPLLALRAAEGMHSFLLGGRGCRFLTVLFLVALQVGDALFHPLRLGGALEVVVEELLHAHGVVALVGLLPQAVQLTIVVDKLALLFQAT